MATSNPSTRIKELTCLSCFKPFFSRTKGVRKYCSLDCANNARTAGMIEPPMLRTTSQKTCPLCQSQFQVTSRGRRKTYCSQSCASKSSNKVRYISLTKEQLTAAINATDTYNGACEILGVSPWTLYRRMKEHGIKRPKRPLKIRPDGYWNYTTHANHRRIMERHTGRRLSAREGVHHLDGDKSNNLISNLVITTGTREHALLHASLQQCAYLLYRAGLIRFNHETRSYELSNSAAHFR
jgi:hypothetical protein